MNQFTKDAGLFFLGIDYVFFFIFFLFIMREIAKLSTYTLKNGKKLIDSGEGRVWIVVSILPFLFVSAMTKTENYVSKQGQDYIYLIAVIFSLVSFYKLVHAEPGLVMGDGSYSPTLMYSIYGIAIFFILISAIGNGADDIKSQRIYDKEYDKQMNDVRKYNEEEDREIAANEDNKKIAAKEDNKKDNKKKIKRIKNEK